MDKLVQRFLIALFLFCFLSGAVCGWLYILCKQDAKQEYESRIIVDDRGPALKELERKALAK